MTNVIKLAKRTDIIEEISNVELSLLNILWTSPPLSAKEIVEALASSQAMHEKTVKILLKSMVLI